jgi:hypothetical protein
MKEHINRISKTGKIGYVLRRFQFAVMSEKAIP